MEIPPQSQKQKKAKDKTTGQAEMAGRKSHAPILSGGGSGASSEQESLTKSAPAASFAASRLLDGLRLPDDVSTQFLPDIANPPAAVHHHGHERLGLNALGLLEDHRTADNRNFVGQSPSRELDTMSRTIGNIDSRTKILKGHAVKPTKG